YRRVCPQYGPVSYLTSCSDLVLTWRENPEKPGLTCFFGVRAKRTPGFGPGPLGVGGAPPARRENRGGGLVGGGVASKKHSHHPEFCLHNGKEGLATTVWRLRPVEPLRVSGAVSTGGRELITRAAIDCLAARPESLQPVDSICLSSAARLARLHGCFTQPVVVAG